MARISLEEALERYGIARWGDGFFSVSRQGELLVLPTREPRRAVSLPALVDRLRAEGTGTPLLFRFPQVLEARVRELADAFAAAREEFNYAGAYRPAYPLKVNQKRVVVETLFRAGRDHGMALEAGSRAELMLALGMGLPPGTMVIVNGYKDRRTLRLAVLGARLGLDVVVVLEKLFEVDRLLEAFADAGEGPLPLVGLRTRLYARGAGRWWKSSGITAKFGLTTSSLLAAIERLRAAGHGDRVRFLHFHLGSQIPEIRRLKAAFREGARTWARLRKMGVPLEYLDVGGGLAVDYDGSRTSSDASRNYSLEEYANDVVFFTGEVATEEGVPHPVLLSESGRALTAHHALLVADVLGRIGADPPPPEDVEVPPDAPLMLRELATLREQIGAKTWREYWHDAVEHRDEMVTLFNIGLIDLPQRALAEQLFWEIARRALAWARKERTLPPEFEQLEKALHEKYIVNFSVFQAAPDHWALDQLFPVVPLRRLREEPTVRASLVDITCDSDGAIERFIDVKDVREALDLHEPEGCPGGRPYDLALCLLGAYQDVMGDQHNLLGAPAEVHVTVDEEGNPRLERVLPPEPAAGVLADFGWDAEELAARAEEALRGRGTAGVDADLLADYRAALAAGTYLSPE